MTDSDYCRAHKSALLSNSFNVKNLINRCRYVVDTYVDIIVGKLGNFKTLSYIMVILLAL